jgi:hypothetical protein
MLWMLLVLNLTTILISARKRVLPYAVLSAAFTFLVVGQAFQIQADLHKTAMLDYAYSHISEHGFAEAVWYGLIVSSISLLLAAFGKGYNGYVHPDPLYKFQPSAGVYGVILGALSVVAAYLVFGVVGISSFIHNSRPGNQPGATLWLTLMGVGIFPLLLKLLYRSEISRFDTLCYSLSLVVSAGFSRLHVIIYIFILLFAFYYGRGWAGRPFDLRICLRIGVVGAAATIFFFVGGALRDAENFTQGTLTDLVNYNLDHPETSLLSLQYTYRVSVEGMSGLAGAFTEALEDPRQVHRDYGLSVSMDGIVQILPSFIKEQLRETISTVDSLYWYRKTAGNVSPGIESTFVSFGWGGAAIYPFFFFWLAWKFPMWVLSRQLSPPLKLTAFMWLGCGVFFVRGNWPDWVAFSASYAVIIFFVWCIFSVCFSKSRSEVTA